MTKNMRGRDDLSRLGDIVVLEFLRPGKHMLLDGVVTLVYTNTYLQSTTTIPSYTVKQAENEKLYTDRT